MSNSSSTIRRGLAFLLLTAGALLIHGYHPYAEDAEIYLPGILKILNPSLFPVNAQFFGEHAGHTFYPNLIAASVRITHLSLPWATFLWQVASIVLLLSAAWRLASALFGEERARWAAACLMAALLTLPVAGTSLYILDQYLNPRNIAAFAALFAVAEVLHRRYIVVLLWLALAAAVHPFMSSFAFMFCAWLLILRAYQPRTLGFAGRRSSSVPAVARWAGVLLPFGITFDPPPAAYHEVALGHPAHFLLRWQWYEWLGLIGPVLLFWWIARVARDRQSNRPQPDPLEATERVANLELLSRAMVPFVVVAAIAAAILSASARFEALARLQPLRCLALGYMVLIVIGGGFLAERLLQGRTWRWFALFIPLSVGMFAAQRQLFPASSHVEWPWAQPRNYWAQAFDWIRGNTPVDALFALDPGHMNLPGEDENGFRARAQRSRLADDVKDQGAASMFPPLSIPWAEQSQDQKNWKGFQSADFERLERKYGVTWIVIQQPGLPGLICRYTNPAVRVCHLTGSEPVHASRQLSEIEQPGFLSRSKSLKRDRGYVRFR